MTPWTRREVDEVIEQHEASMKEAKYPESIVTELRRSRGKFLARVKVIDSAEPSQA